MLNCSHRQFQVRVADLISARQVKALEKSVIIKRRRPWLAVLLSLFTFPLGHIYVGRFRRAIVLWLASVVLLGVVLPVCLRLPIGGGVVLSFLICLLAVPLGSALDAFILARRQGDTPLKSYQRVWCYLLVMIGATFANNLAAQTIITCLGEAFQIPTRAMSPAIQAGDRILVDNLWRHTTSLQRHDIVVFDSEGPGSPLYIMRVIGLPGETIEIINEQVSINGTVLPDPHAVKNPELPVESDLAYFGPVTIPADSFFVLGDDRRRARDSRILGPIPLSGLHGKARMVYWSREHNFPDRNDSSHFVSGPVRWSRIGSRLD